MRAVTRPRNSFADGMTDELTSTLAKIPGVRVASRSATSAAIKTGGDANMIAQRLSVGAILEGRIRRAGNRMRLTAQLSNPKDGLILWTETYDREVKDAFLVQDDVARAIAAALRVTLGGEQQLASRGTSSSEAHDLISPRTLCSGEIHRGRPAQIARAVPGRVSEGSELRDSLGRDRRFVGHPGG